MITKEWRFLLYTQMNFIHLDMLHDFNDNFQHCVLAGTTKRFSATYRKVPVSLQLHLGINYYRKKITSTLF